MADTTFLDTIFADTIVKSSAVSENAIILLVGFALACLMIEVFFDNTRGPW